MTTDRLSQIELAAYMALLEASGLLQQRVDRQLKAEGGITQAQFEILALVAMSPDGLRMSDLAARAVLSRSGMTYRVAQLEKRGLIARSGNAEDDRSVIASATDEGTALIARLLPPHLALVRESFLSVLSPTDLDALSNILTRIVTHLRASEDHTPDAS